MKSWNETPRKVQVLKIYGVMEHRIAMVFMDPWLAVVQIKLSAYSDMSFDCRLFVALWIFGMFELFTSMLILKLASYWNQHSKMHINSSIHGREDVWGLIVTNVLGPE